jgi:YesN/AraC family two-component response regulator
MTTILVIEDEAQTRNLFIKSLQFEGFNAYGASNGTEGLNLAQTIKPDLIVCDILMPDINGHTVLSKLRNNPKTVSIPFIFLTAKVTMADLRQGMELGADDYLTKPCTIEQFLSAIATRLQRQADLLQYHHHQDDTPNFLGDHGVNIENLEFSFPDSEQLNRVFEFIEANYNRNIKLEDVANAAGYSPAYLTNLVKKQTGNTIKQWIINRKMAAARMLLQSGKQSVSAIAEKVGYPDAGYFSNKFRQFHGISPLAWRKNNY